MSTFYVKLDKWDKDISAWDCPVLAIPGIKVRDALADGLPLSPSLYNPDPDARVVHWKGTTDRPEQIVLKLELTKRVTTQMQAAVITALATVAAAVITYAGTYQTAHRADDCPPVKIDTPPKGPASAPGAIPTPPSPVSSSGATAAASSTSGAATERVCQVIFRNSLNDPQNKIHHLTGTDNTAACIDYGNSWRPQGATHVQLGCDREGSKKIDWANRMFALVSEHRYPQTDSDPYAPWPNYCGWDNSRPYVGRM